MPRRGGKGVGRQAEQPERHGRGGRGGRARRAGRAGAAAPGEARRQPVQAQAHGPLPDHAQAQAQAPRHALPRPGAGPARRRVTRPGPGERPLQQLRAHRTSCRISLSLASSCSSSFQCVLQRVTNWDFNAFILDTAAGGERALPQRDVYDMVDGQKIGSEGVP